MTLKYRATLEVARRNGDHLFQAGEDYAVFTWRADAGSQRSFISYAACEVSLITRCG